MIGLLIVLIIISLWSDWAGFFLVGFFACQVFCGCLCRSSSNSPQCTLSPSLLTFFFFVISVKLIGGRITIVYHPLLCFLPLHYNLAVLVAAMLLLSFFV